MPMPLSVPLVYSYCSMLAVKLRPYPGPVQHITYLLITQHQFMRSDGV